MTNNSNYKRLSTAPKNTPVTGTDPGGAGSGAHPWDEETRAEGAGSFVSRAERRDTGIP